MPQDLTRIIDQYGENGVFIVTSEDIYWCNGNKIKHLYKHCFEEEIIRSRMYDGNIQLQTNIHAYQFNEDSKRWEMQLQYIHKMYEDKYDFPHDGLGCVYKDGVLEAHLFDRDNMYFNFRKKSYLLTEHSLLIYDKAQKKISVQKEFNSRNYIIFAIKKDLFIIQKSNNLLLKKNHQTDELTIQCQITNANFDNLKAIIQFY